MRPKRWLVMALVSIASCAAQNDDVREGVEPPDAAGTVVATGGSTGDSGRDARVGAGDSVGSGGGAARGGATGTGGATGSGASMAIHEAGPITVGKCDGLAGAGVWEDITPPDEKTAMANGTACFYGGSFVLDWSSSGTAYLGTCNVGIWKTTDCGSSWVHINTGKNGAVLDTGRQWTFSIDPVDPKILYTNSGYGAQSNGAFKSTNGGVDWEQIWPPADPALANVVDYNFVQLIALDPYDRQHLLLSFHSTCKAPYTSICMAESRDAGASWRVLNGNPSWSIAEAQYTYFLESSSTWLWALGSNGLWRTTDSGAHWTSVASQAGGHNFSPVYRAVDNAFYLSLNTGLYRSPDGIAWSQIMSTAMIGITGNGTTLYTSQGFPWNPGQGPAPYQPFKTSPETDGQKWTQLDSPKLLNGGTLAYDAGHHILYSSNLEAGFYRVVTGP